MAGHAKQKKRFAKKKKIDFRGPLLALAAAVLFPSLLVAAFLVNFNVDTYRDQIAAALAQQTGRDVAIEGPVAWNFSLSQGLNLHLKNVKIGNPAWADHPLMAQLGDVSLRIDPLALWNRKIAVSSAEIDRGDYQAEIGLEGLGNWIFQPARPAPDEEETLFFKQKTQKPPRRLSLDFDIGKVEIKDSRVGFKRDSGKVDVYDIPSLLIEKRDGGTHAHFNGFIGATPIEADLAGSGVNLLSAPDWPFNLEALYAGARVKAKGHIADRINLFILDEFSLEAGKSRAAGQVQIDLAGLRPMLRGRLESPFLNFLDFHFNKDGKNIAAFVNEKLSALQPGGREPLFNAEPIETDFFEHFDADLSFRAETLQWGLIAFHDLDTKIAQENGHVTLAPFSVSVAGSRIGGAVKFDVQDAAVKGAAALKGRGLEFSKLFDWGGIGSLIAGKVDLDMTLQTEGASLRDLASKAAGRLYLLMDTGTLSPSPARKVASSVMNFFFPAAGAIMGSGVNCMAARYRIGRGLMKADGFLIDMDSTTIAGEGTINLPDEYISMNLHTRPKSVGLTAMVPSMRIAGPLLSPDVSFDTENALQKVTGALTDAGGDSFVPKMLHIEGRNDCEVTLENPALASGSALSRAGAPLVPGGGGTFFGLIKGIGEKFWHFMSGTLFGG